jgi:uncharacterized protein (TIGR02598 family)
MILSSTRTARRSASSGRNRPAGFSLVEVALALGIVSFVLLSLLGLMTVSLDAGRRSYEDTTVASLAQVVANELRTNSYSSLPNTNFERYFSYDGEPSDAGAAHYRCTIQAETHTSAELPSAVRDASQGVRLRLSFFWPPDNPRTNEIFETTIARY